MNYEYQSVDLVILGGSLGGVAAAYSAAKMGLNIILTEETKWIGGQLTSQAVPPDEHPWIEKFGSTESYRTFRNKIRHYYKRNFPLTFEAYQDEYFNPGNAIVSNLSHEPKVALAVMYEMLAPFIHNKQLTIFTEHKLISAEAKSDRVESVKVLDLNNDKFKTFVAPMFLDATETGELLPLAGIEYVTGSESQKETGEPHALKGEADPLDMQAITHCFAVDYVPNGDFTIEKPEQYDFWKEYKPSFWPGKLLDWVGVQPDTLESRPFTLFPDGKHFSLWEYRRLVSEKNFKKDSGFKDVSLINWQQNDYWLGPIFEVEEEEARKHLEGAKQLSLSLLYWLQTDAPRFDGRGYGYPELRLRKDVVGTEDGLAMAPYIRESRRIRARFTVLEQHVSTEVRGKHGAKKFDDSVGIGAYHIDLHPSTGNRHYIDFSSLPFQIPLGALIPIRVENVLPACKNIGVTHITNGCYRLHPVEWNIGEVAGYLSAYTLQQNYKPKDVYENKNLLSEFQRLLIKQGIELEWPHIHAL